MMAEEIRLAVLNDEQIGMLSEPILHSRLSAKVQVQQSVQPYQLFRDEIVILNGIAMMGRRKIIPAAVQDKALKQLCVNLMGIEKTRLLAYEYIYWVNMNANRGTLQISPLVWILKQHDQMIRQCYIKFQGDHGSL